MLFGTGRNELRRTFFDVQAKRRARTMLEPLEALIAGVIDDHPEYHALLERGPDNIEREFPSAAGVANPFLHMALHVALREQIAADRPAGVGEAQRVLSGRLGSALAAEHAIIECLAETLWSAQRAGVLPDEQAYLECVSRLIGGSGVS